MFTRHMQLTVNPARVTLFKSYAGFFPSKCSPAQLDVPCALKNSLALISKNLTFLFYLLQVTAILLQLPQYGFRCRQTRSGEIPHR